MNRPFTIAHISDLHISLHHSRENIRTTRKLIEYCFRQGADHIVITGDITADAEKKELEAARKIFRTYGMLDSRKLTLVIGNHDIFGGVHRAEEILSFPKRCKTTDYDRKVKDFHDTFAETFENTTHGKHEKWYPFVKVLDHTALIGVNSIARYSRVNNPIGSNGELDDGQYERLKEMLTSEPLRNKRKIVLIHHHFNKMKLLPSGAMSNIWNAVERQTMKLRGKKRILELFAAAHVDLVLHGHLHESSEYIRKGTRFINAGGSVIGVNQKFHVAFVRSTPKGIITDFRSIPQRTNLSIPNSQREPEARVPVAA